MAISSRSGLRSGRTSGWVKIFDVTGQRDRAVNEYKLALRTKDNTYGALEEASKYAQKPYERKRLNN